MKLFTTAILATVLAQQDYDEDFESNYSPEDDGEHKKGDVQYIHIDQGWVDFAARTDTIFRSLFSGVVNDADFIANVAEQKREDEELCQAGEDPFGRRVKCRNVDDTTGFRTIKSSYMTNSRKQAQLKIMTFWLSPSNNVEFGKFCNYGCHCLANLSDRGYGVPVDEVDKQCKSLAQCYECAKLGTQASAANPNCDGPSTKYRYRLYTNTITGDKWIRCLNPPGSCARNICECDVRNAERLAATEDQWDVKYHTLRNDGAWKYNEQCHRGTKGAYGKPETCCGSAFPDVIPMQTGKQCCGYRPYDPTGTRKCCAENKLRDNC